MAREAGVPTMLPSCGKERDLVRWCAQETDLNCINPPVVAPMGDCDQAEIKRAHGRQLALTGNPHTTSVMLFGAPAEVEDAARAAIDAAGSGGGFVLYYLFYSANDFASPRYAVGYAAAAEPLGPYTKAEEPLLATDFEALVIGPGGQDVVAHPGGETWILFHDWAPAGYRHLNLVPLAWQDGRPAVQLGAGPWPLPEPAAEE
jgi:hypothetical protein